MNLSSTNISAAIRIIDQRARAIDVRYARPSAEALDAVIRALA